MAVRTIKQKQPSEVLKFFEQLRKNISMNKSWSTKESAEKSAALKDIKKNFYDGLIRDLMTLKKYDLAEIVMVEKQKEKFPETIEDEITELNIYAAQNKFPNYMEKFEQLIDDDGKYAFTKEIAQILGETLMKFNGEE